MSSAAKRLFEIYEVQRGDPADCVVYAVSWYTVVGNSIRTLLVLIRDAQPLVAKHQTVRSSSFRT